MKIFLAVYFVFVLFFLKTTKAQDYSVLEDQFKTSSVLSNIHYGFSLYDLDKKEKVYAVREHQHFTPASNTKIYTLLASLNHLGDSIVGLQYMIKGDSLIFWGTGDPTFLHPKLDNHKVFDFLKKANKKLFYVAKETSEPPFRNGWSIEDFQEYYQPDIAPFPIYGNIVRFSVKEGNVKVFPHYFSKYLRRNNRFDKDFQILRSQYSNDFEYQLRDFSKVYSTSKPFIWSDSLFVELLQDTLNKDVHLMPAFAKPSDVKVVYSVSRDILLREMMLPSDNFLAEQLTMLISSAKFNKFDTDSLRHYLQKEFYTNFQDSIVIRDGSGLSTYNKITPSNMVDLLLAINEKVSDDNQRNLFFPMGGIDGTLKNAYPLDLSVPFVWAKTGTINSVHCQSGYLETREGRRLVFSFLNNNYIVPTSEIRNEMVRIMTFIRQNY